MITTQTKIETLLFVVDHYIDQIEEKKAQLKEMRSKRDWMDQSIRMVEEEIDRLDKTKIASEKLIEDYRAGKYGEVPREYSQN